MGLLLNLKYPGSTTGFCVGLLLNLKFSGSTTGFCGFVAQLKYPGSTTGFCVGLLLNPRGKYPGSTTGFCVGLLLNLKYPGSTTGFCVGLLFNPSICVQPRVCCSILSTLFNHGVLCGFVSTTGSILSTLVQPRVAFVWVCCSILSLLPWFNHGVLCGFVAQS